MWQPLGIFRESIEFTSIILLHNVSGETCFFFFFLTCRIFTLFVPCSYNTQVVNRDQDWEATHPLIIANAQILLVQNRFTFWLVRALFILFFHDSHFYETYLLYYSKKLLHYYSKKKSENICVLGKKKAKKC